MTGTERGARRQTFQVSENEPHFLQILETVERGETVLLTRGGKPVARMEPEPQFDRERVARAFQSIREIRERTLPMSVEEILAARDEGRR